MKNIFTKKIIPLLGLILVFIATLDVAKANTDEPPSSAAAIAVASCPADPCDPAPICDDCIIVTDLTDDGSIPFSIVYDAATNGANTQDLTIPRPADANCDACEVTVDYTLNYTIDPSQPAGGISWTSEASFEIIVGGVVVASGGPGLPGSANNGIPINGSVSGTFTVTNADLGTPSITLSIEDSFDDANEDGTFSGTLDYTIDYQNKAINAALVPVEQACDDGNACTVNDVELVLPCLAGPVECVACAGTPADPPTVEIEKVKCFGNPDGDLDPTNDVDEYSYTVTITFPGVLPDPANTTIDVTVDGTTTSVTPNGTDVVYVVSSNAAGAPNVPITAGGNATVDIQIAGSPCFLVDVPLPVVEECSCFQRICEDVTDISAFIPEVTGNNMDFTQTYVLVNSTTGDIIETNPDRTFDLTGTPQSGGATLCEVWGVNFDPADAAAVAAATTIQALCDLLDDPTVCVDLSCNAFYIEKLPIPFPPVPKDATFCIADGPMPVEVFNADDCTELLWFDPAGNPIADPTAAWPTDCGTFTYTVVCRVEHVIPGDCPGGVTECLSQPAEVNITLYPEVDGKVHLIKCDGNPDGNPEDPTKAADAYTYSVLLTFSCAWPADGGTLEVFEASGDFACSITPTAGATGATVTCDTGIFTGVADGASTIDITAISKNPFGRAVCTNTFSSDPVQPCSDYERVCTDIVDFQGPTSNGTENTGPNYTQTYVLVDAGGIIVQENDMSVFDLSGLNGLCSIAGVNFDNTLTPPTITPGVTPLSDLANNTDPNICVDVSFNCWYVFKLPVPAPPIATFVGPFCGDDTIVIGAECDKDANGEANVVWYTDDPANGGTVLGTGEELTITPNPAVPGGGANQAFTVWACCEATDAVDTDACQSCAPITYTVDATPDPSFTCPVVDRCGDPVDLMPMEPNGYPGTWSGTGSGNVDPATNTFNPKGAPVGCELTLTYTATSPNGCVTSTSCTFTVGENCNVDASTFNNN